MLSDELPASRGQPRSPSEVVERVWRATRSKGGDRDGAANLEVVLLTVSAAGSTQNWHGPGQGYRLHFSCWGRERATASQCARPVARSKKRNRGGAGFIFEFLSVISARRRPICTSRCMQPTDMIRNSCPSGTFPPFPRLPTHFPLGPLPSYPDYALLCQYITY